MTKQELDEQALDSNSELNQWAEKSRIKKEVKKKRKNDKYDLVKLTMPIKL